MRDAAGRFVATHGHTSRSNLRSSPEYRSWNAMRMRCKDPERVYYAACGITVCPEWDSFEQFLSDMGPRPKGTTLDRRDGTKGYYKDNCRWATHREQQQNVKSNKNYTFEGETHCLREWARRLSADYARFQQRIARGWSVERTLSTPTRRIAWS